MGQGVRRNFMPRVDRSDIGCIDLEVLDDLSLSRDRILASAKQLGIQIKGRLQAVFVEYFDQSDILIDAVVIAEGKRLHFSVEQSYIIS